MAKRQRDLPFQIHLFLNLKEDKFKLIDKTYAAFHS
jgi:hypothetical protein